MEAFLPLHIRTRSCPSVRSPAVPMIGSIIIHAKTYTMKQLDIQHFWQWFEDHQNTFLCVHLLPDEQQQLWMDRLREQLCRINKELGLEIRPRLDNGKSWMILSAFGEKQYFDEIDHIIEAAPLLESWAFIPLYPASGLEDGLLMRYEGLPFNPFELEFCQVHFLQSSERRQLILFAEDDSYDTIENKVAAWDLVMHLIGERAAAAHFSDLLIAGKDMVSEALLPYFMPITELADCLEINKVDGLWIGPNGLLATG